MKRYPKERNRFFSLFGAMKCPSKPLYITTLSGMPVSLRDDILLSTSF